MKKRNPKRTEPLNVRIPEHLRGREFASAVPGKILKSVFGKEGK